MAETLSTEPSSTSKAAMKTTTETVEKETFKSPLKSWKRFTTTGPPPAKPSYENRGRSAVSVLLLFFVFFSLNFVNNISEFRIFVLGNIE